MKEKLQQFITLDVYKRQEYSTAIILLPCGKVRIISVDKCCRCLAAVRGKDRVADGISENRDIFIIQDVA